ncbi:hypothetical protein ACNKHV_22430 [Shigella flexneri]
MTVSAGFAGDDLPSNPVAVRWRLLTRWIPWRVSTVSVSIQRRRRPVCAASCHAGVLRTIVEKNLNLNLQTLTEEAVRLYGDKLTNANVVDDVIDSCSVASTPRIRTKVIPLIPSRRYWRVVQLRPAKSMPV